jgi:hypothetical protein
MKFTTSIHELEVYRREKYAFELKHACDEAKELGFVSTI